MLFMAFVAKLWGAVALLYLSKEMDGAFFQNPEHPRLYNLAGSTAAIGAFCLLIWGFK